MNPFVVHQFAIKCFYLWFLVFKTNEDVLQCYRPEVYMQCIIKVSITMRLGRLILDYTVYSFLILWVFGIVFDWSTISISQVGACSKQHQTQPVNMKYYPTIRKAEAKRTNIIVALLPRRSRHHIFSRTFLSFVAFNINFCFTSCVSRNCFSSKRKGSICIWSCKGKI